MSAGFVQNLLKSPRTNFLFAFCCAVSGTCLSQDSSTVNMLNALSKKYWSRNSDSSVYYAQKALELSKTLNYKKGIAESYRNMGVSRSFAGDNLTAIRWLKQALQLYSELGDNRGLAATYNNLGVAHTNASDFIASNRYHDSALVLFRKLGNQEGEGSVLNYMGINFKEQGNYLKAIDFCLQGYEVRKKINDHPGVVFSLINVGNMYLDVGQMHSALNFYNQSVSYAKDHHMEPFDYSLNQIGATYLRLKQYDSAESYLVRTIQGRKSQINDPLAAAELYRVTGRLDSASKLYTMVMSWEGSGNKTGLAKALIGLSQVFLEKKNLERSLSYAQRAYTIADSIHNKIIKADAANVLGIVNKNLGDFKKSLDYFELAHSVIDSITGENYQRTLAFAESKNEIENQQAQVKLLSAEKNLELQKRAEEQFIYKLSLIVFAVAGIASFIIIRNINRKRKQIQLQKDQIELQSAKVEKAYEDLKSTQAQLIQREKMASLGELTAGIAHEIQNPLNFVNNFSEVNAELIDELKMLKSNPDSYRDKSERTEKLESDLLNDIAENEKKIIYHGKRADAIVKGMLQHSRSSSGAKEPTDMNALADEYLRLAYQGLRAKDKSFNTTLKTEFDKTLGEIRIIPQDIGRVLLNLYNNAFYAVNEKKKMDINFEPVVVVETGRKGERAEIRIRDNGNGVSKNIVGKIFQPFFTTKPTGQGTGLGLSLSYDIVKAHGGDITVESVDGKGSEFVVSLPL